MPNFLNFFVFLLFLSVIPEFFLEQSGRKNIRNLDLLMEEDSRLRGNDRRIIEKRFPIRSGMTGIL